MYIEEEDLYNNIWALRGNEKEFAALRNVVTIAQSAEHSFSSTEVKVIRNIQTQVWSEILKEK